jgi:molecular chaperone DnaK (HSP70)
MGKIVGIDLGTTNSVVATVDLGGPRILQNKEAEQQTRSVVGFNKGEFLVGTPALRRWPLAPKETIISIKRLMGRSYADSEVAKIKTSAQYELVEPTEGTKDSVCVKLGGKEYYPVDISAMILSKLKRDAEFVLGEKVTHAVITVPAYFGDKQKYATREAGLKAGLTVMKILDEPTAAAIAFGMEAKESEAKTVLVYDLGGGTFDISIMMMAAGAFAPLNLEGDMWLGGDNFDQAIVDYVTAKIKKEIGIDATKNLRFMATLKSEAQKAKEALGAARSAEIIIPGILQDGAGNYLDVTEEITREHFEDMIRPLVDRTVTLVKKAVANANFSLGDIDYVLMAGNSTCVPMVQEAMSKLFGEEKIQRKVHPKNCVAIGAALAAAVFDHVICPKCEHNNNLDALRCEKCGTQLVSSLDKKKCSNCEAENDKSAPKCEKCGLLFIEITGVKGGIAPFHYGVQTAGDRFNVFITKSDGYETPEEKRKVQTFFTRYPDMRMINIPVYGGEDLQSASKNAKMGEVFAILPANLPQETPIRIKLWLNKEGYFELNAQLDDGTDLHPWILRGEGDQLAIETFVKAEAEKAKKEHVFTPEEKAKAEEMRNTILDKLKSKKFDEAREKANELLKYVEDAGKVDESQLLRQNAENLVGYTMYIVNEYGWLIGQAAYKLNNLIGGLQEALHKNDTNMIEAKLNELSIEIGNLMQVPGPGGQPVPSMLGTFLTLHGVIVTMIQPTEPALAQNLREKLSAVVEQAFKNHQPDAMTKLENFGQELEQALGKIPPPKEGIPCPLCGHHNMKMVMYCEACKANLGLLGSQRTGSSSRG